MPRKETAPSCVITPPAICRFAAVLLSPASLGIASALSAKFTSSSSSVPEKNCGRKANPPMVASVGPALAGSRSASSDSTMSSARPLATPSPQTTSPISRTASTPRTMAVTPLRLRGAFAFCSEKSSSKPSLTSHPFRRADPEQAQTVPQHLAGGIVEPQSGAMQVADLLVAERGHAADVVPPVIRGRQLFAVPGDAVRLSQFRRLGDDARELREDAHQDALGLVTQQLRLEDRTVDAEGRRVLRHRVGAGVRVLHVEDGVVVGALAQQFGIEGERRVGWIAPEGVPQSIRSQPFAQVVQLDDV